MLVCASVYIELYIPIISRQQPPFWPHGCDLVPRGALQGNSLLLRTELRPGAERSGHFILLILEHFVLDLTAPTSGLAVSNGMYPI